MGAQGSRSQPDENDQATGEVEDYYGLLGVEETATADEIKVRFLNNMAFTRSSSYSG